MKDSLSKDWVWRIVTPVLVGIALVVMWEAICRGFQIPDYLFPAPTSVAASFRENFPLLLISLQSTALVALKAFLLAILLGTLASFLFVESRFAEIGIFPYVVLLQVTPIVAIAPLIIILVKSTELSLVICATLVALFPIISNTVTGLKSIDPGLLSYFKMKRSSRLNILIKLRIPSALPFFLAGLRISGGLSLIGPVVAEVLAGTGGGGRDRRPERWAGISDPGGRFQARHSNDVRRVAAHCGPGNPYVSCHVGSD